MLFEWDEAKRLKNIEKHKIDFVDAVKIFKAFIHTVQDTRADYGEERFLTVGLLNEVEITVIHTKRGAATRIISARRARVKERNKYHEEALKMGTDFEALRTMTDDDIDCSDIPEMTDEELRSGVGLWLDSRTEFMPLALDTEMLEYFRKDGHGYAMKLSRIVNTLLREYVRQQTSQEVI